MWQDNDPTYTLRRYRALKFLLLIVGVFAFGITGYTTIEDWSFFDALYMTAITITTTGYSEVHRLSDSGRAFTVFLMIAGVSAFTYGIREFFASQFLLDADARRRRYMNKEISNLKDHVIVCGFGRMGRVICEELHKKEVPFVVIEKKTHSIEELKDTKYLWIDGDASDDNDLIQANITFAKTFLTVIDHDADTLYALMAAKNLNPDVYAICRANTETAKLRLTRLGANQVVLPLATSALNVARMVINPATEAWVRFSEDHLEGEHPIDMVEFRVRKGSEAENSFLRDVVTEKFVVVGIKTLDQRFDFAPKGEYQLQEGDKVLGLCRSSDQEAIRQHFAS